MTQLPVPAAGWPAPPPGRVPEFGIGRRLFVYTLLFSALVTLLLTALQIYVDYRRDLEALDARVREIERSNLLGISRALWHLDDAQLNAQLAGILDLQDVHAVDLREELPDGVDVPRHIRMGAGPAADALVWELPVTFTEGGVERPIGVLRIEASRDSVLRRVQTRALSTLGAQAVETFLVALFILLVVHRMVTRHLVALARVVESYDVRAPAMSFRLRRRSPRGGDELDRVVEALEDMRGNLERAYRELSDANAELERDIVARRRAEAAAAHLAHHDALTDLPNRRLLFDRLQHELSFASRTNSQGALLFVDLDHFKTLNDARGHSVGDAILIEAARRLAANLRDVDLVARLGGDEFVAVLSSVGPTPDAAARTALTVANKLRAVLAAPLELAGEVHRLTASIGIALFPADGTDIETLLKHADVAMYHAKSEGRNSVHFFQPTLHAAVEARHDLEIQLRATLAGDGFSLAYQPLVDAAGALLGAEVLIRWDHPTRGRISPAQFIPICEESGLIIAVGEWVLAHAAQQLRRWLDRGVFADGLYLGINISPRQFRQADFVSRLERICTEHGIDPNRLVLEITEGVVLGELDDTIARINALRGRGVRFFIDDFGSGYSSMAYLKRLPVDGLKIDQQFVRDLSADANDAAIVEAILAIGHRFGLTVVAEGVENEEQVAFLTALRCQAFQGYHFGRPTDPAIFEQQFLRK